MKTVDMKIYHLNVIHMYNFGMGSIGVEEQLCMQYTSYHWMPNRKWMWSILLSGLGGDVINE